MADTTDQFQAGDHFQYRTEEMATLKVDRLEGLGYTVRLLDRGSDRYRYWVEIMDIPGESKGGGEG